MKYALQNGVKTEAAKGAKGTCPSCGAELIARCGNIKINHWAHKGERNCDPWWENETDWHRLWKNNFPNEWQEVIHFDEAKEKHIADVKTETGWVIEFQHSFLNYDERMARNKYYSKLIWVVDCTRRKTDKPQFIKKINESKNIGNKYLILKASFPDECRVIKEWQDDNSLVFFDFQDGTDSVASKLWFLFPRIIEEYAYLTPFSRERFIELLNKNKFDEFYLNVIIAARDVIYKSEQRIATLNRNVQFNRFLNMQRKRYSRSRRRF